MALFRLKKDKKVPGVSPPRKESDAQAATRAASIPAAAHGGGDVAHVLRSPRITEKASAHMSEGVYTFDVALDATKRSVSQAIAAAYGVRPRMVRIVAVRRKTRRSSRTGQYGMSRGGKKAYVYLKRGDSITLG